MNWIIPIDKLILSDKVGDWCQLEYPGHKKGCPNYGKSDRCPPKAPHISDYFDLTKPLYFVHSEFDLSIHVERMRNKHPNWSERQLKCLLYWQGSSQKQMKERVNEAVKLLKTNRMTACPEGMGVNVFATARLSGLTIERTRDIKICRHVTLIGYSHER